MDSIKTLFLEHIPYYVLDTPHGISSEGVVTNEITKIIILKEKMSLFMTKTYILSTCLIKYLMNYHKVIFFL